MKQNKGLTLISLIIYVIALSIFIGTMSMLIKYFYKNTNEVVINEDSSQQYARFLEYITDDINSRKNTGISNKRRG